MSLDLYVGSLTRYFCNEWETPAEQLARKKGIPIASVRDGEKREKEKREDVHPQVIEWKQKLNDALKDHFATPADWNEEQSAPYFIDQLYYQGHSSLMLWAAYLEHPDLARPKGCVEEFQTDDAYVRCADEESKTEFKNLLRGTVCWLPVDFVEPFVFTDICEEDLCYGSAWKLLDELRILNSKTWKADKTTVERWRRFGLGQSCSLEDAAKYGFSVMMPMCEKAIEHKLVMRLDW